MRNGTGVKTDENGKSSFESGWIAKPVRLPFKRDSGSPGGWLMTRQFRKLHSQVIHREAAVVVSAVAPEVHSGLASRNEKSDRPAA